MLIVLTLLAVGLPLYLSAEIIHRRRIKKLRVAQAPSQSDASIDAATAQAKDEPARAQRPRWRVWSRVVLAGLFLIFLVHNTMVVIEIFRLRESNPATTSFIEARIKQAEARGEALKREQQWVSYDEISPNLARAVLVGEDWRFFSHSGLDLFAILRAIEENWDLKRIEKGGSTISQQLAKNIFLSSTKNPVRKLYEALITYEMEWILGKRRILEIYLNVVEWGDGIYGAEAAARHYFNTSAASLNSEQAALLGAILPNPREAFNPEKYPDRVRDRSAWVLSLMSFVTIADSKN